MKPTEQMDDRIEAQAESPSEAEALAGQPLGGSSAGAPRDPMPDRLAPPRALARVLAEVRHRLRRAALVEGLALVAAGATAALLAGVLGSTAGLGPTGIALLELLVFLSAGGFALARYGLVLSRAFGDEAQVARWLDRAVRGSGDTRVSFRSAVELARDRGRYGESVELADVAIGEAGTRAGGIDAARLVAAEARPALKRKLLALIVLASAAALFGLVLPAHFRAALGAASSLGELENPLSSLPPEPRFGDVRLTYRFPNYAQRPQVTVESPSGEIRALPGTEITIETHARSRLSEATLIVVHGEDDESSRSAVEVDGRHLRATMIVSRAGRYRFRVRTEDGELLEERRGRAIELEADLPPEVALLLPETSPLEVNEHDRVDVEFRASDDFALGDVRIAWRVLGTAREGRQPLTSAARGKKRHSEAGVFDLTPLGLKPGDRVSYSIEALDSDTVNGPKIGASETKELRVYSKEAHHREVLALAEQALDELVHILGDNLENAFALSGEPKEYESLLGATAKILERARAANKLLRDTVAALKKDPIGQKPIAAAFETARVDLQKSVRSKTLAFEETRMHFERSKAPDERRTKAVARRQDQMVADLEKNVVYLADLLNDQRMIDAEALTKQLREEQQNLRKALEEYRTAPTEERRRALEQAIREIKARISEITAELSKLRGSIPQDFVNPDALETQDTLEGMDRVQRMIEEGDLDGAMAELEKMLNETERMLAEMQQGREELGSREYSEITEQARELWKNLEEIEADQGALGRKAEQQSRAMLDAMKDRLGDAEAFIEKQKKRLDQAEKAVQRAEPGSHFTEGDSYDQAKRRIEDTKKALEAKDFGAAREAVEQALGQLAQLEIDAERRAEQARRFGDFFGHSTEAETAAKELGKARPMVEEVFRDIEQLMPDPDELLSPEERQEMSRLADRQKGIRQRTESLQEQLEKLSEQLPIVGEGTKEVLGEAQQAMGETERGLGKGDAPGALGDHQRAMDALGRLREALQKMGERGQGQGGGGVPLPFGPEGAPGQEDQSGQGNDPTILEKVEIPKPEQYKAPAEFREDILKAAKQGTAEAYKEAVRRYYEEIVK